MLGNDCRAVDELDHHHRQQHMIEHMSENRSRRDDAIRLACLTELGISESISSVLKYLTRILIVILAFIPPVIDPALMTHPLCRNIPANLSPITQDKGI